ncbi:MAG: MOSC domain-containing protein [Nitrospirales bacterium]
MSNVSQSEMGVIQSLWRYPVKSMMGESLSLAEVNVYGIQGDRAYAILDETDGKVATAKNPKKWPGLFSFQASLREPSGDKKPGAGVRITLPDGRVFSSEQQELPQILSQALNRKVTLAVMEEGRVTGLQSTLPGAWIAQSEEYWPDMDGREKRDTVTDFSLPTGTFFDAAMVHLLTTATLNRLREAYPEGRFEVPRFRPNLVVASGEEQKGFIENHWVGHTLAIGDEVRLKITGSCARCVMTTLAQGELPKDTGVLRTAVQHNHGHVGVYASVVQGGVIRSGDRVRLED